MDFLHLLHVGRRCKALVFWQLGWRVRPLTGPGQAASPICLLLQVCVAEQIVFAVLPGRALLVAPLFFAPTTAVAAGVVVPVHEVLVAVLLRFQVSTVLPPADASTSSLVGVVLLAPFSHASMPALLPVFALLAELAPVVVHMLFAPLPVPLLFVLLTFLVVVVVLQWHLVAPVLAVVLVSSDLATAAGAAALLVPFHAYVAGGAAAAFLLLVFLHPVCSFFPSFLSLVPCEMLKLQRLAFQQPGAGLAASCLLLHVGLQDVVARVAPQGPFKAALFFSCSSPMAARCSSTKILF